MADQILETPSAPQGTPTEPSMQQGGAEAQQQGKSSIQRLKGRLVDTQNALESSRRDNAVLQSQLEDLRERVDKITSQGDPKRPEDWPEADLSRIAFSPDSAQHEALKATFHLIMKKLEERDGAVSEQVESRIENRFGQAQQQSHFATEVSRLAERYGAENLSPGAELHDVAESYFNADLQRAERTGEVNDYVRGVLKLRAIEQAARDLNASSPTPTPPEENVTATSTAAAPETVSQSSRERREQLMAEGKVDEAIRELVREQDGV